MISSSTWWARTIRAAASDEDADKLVGELIRTVRIDEVLCVRRDVKRAPEDALDTVLRRRFDLARRR